MGIDLIFAADALHPPLTGIGRYSLELARRLEHGDRVARMRYFAMGQWLPSPIASLERNLEQPPDSATDLPARPASDTLQRWRRQLSGNRAAVQAYHALSPWLFGWRLRGNRNAIFHAPNYFVPPFDGRTVSTVHDLSHIRHPDFHPRARVDYMNLALPPSLRRTDHVITVSQATRQEFLTLFPHWEEDRVTAILLAADAAFHPRSTEAIAPALHMLHQTPGNRRTPDASPCPLVPGRYSLFVGTIEPRKNIDRLLTAYSQLPQTLRREYPLVIAGSQGWQSESTHRRIAQAQDEGWLHYLCFVPQTLLPHVYGGAALFIYPSLYEGFGLPIVEAMASGVPVITSATSSMPEVAGGAARLVNPLQTEDIRHAIMQCLEDPDWRSHAIQAGLQRASQFSWDTCVAQTMGIYQKLSP